MKIKCIKRIYNHRIFKDFWWPNTLPEFGRFNVIYGWNGAGKTTLSNLFHHLETNKPVEEGEVSYLIGEWQFRLSDLPSESLPNVRVFNRDSVDRTVFELPAKQFPPIYFLGEGSVEKQKHIEVLKTKLVETRRNKQFLIERKLSAERERDTFCTTEARTIKMRLTVTGGGPYNNYDSRSFKQTANRLSSIKNPVTVPSDEQIAQYIIRKDSKLKAKLQPLNAKFPDVLTLNSEVTSSLRRSVVSYVIDEVTRNPSLAEWLDEGLMLHTGEHSSRSCRFCEQPLPSGRLERLEAHFNDEFKRFQEDLQLQIKRIQNVRQQINNLPFPEKSLLYEHLAPQYEKAVSTLAQQRPSFNLYLDTLLKALHAKKDKPFEVIELQSFFSVLDANEEVGWLPKILNFIGTGAVTAGAMYGQNALNQIDGLIEQHNRYTDNFQESIATAQKALEEAYVAVELNKFNGLCEAATNATKEELDTVQKVKKIQQEIEGLEREIRHDRRPAEQLNAEIHSFLGRSELKFETKDSGYSITRNGHPALHLSEGERTAIAFMYFLKSLEDASFDLKTGIVVIDDPVSSLDSNSLYNAFGFMKARTKEAGQLFILTHNFTFFRQVRNWFQHLPGQNKKEITQRPARFYMLLSTTQNNARSATLEPLDKLLSDFESEYHYLFKRVYEVAHRASAGPMEINYEMPNIARRLLESFLAFRLPGVSGGLYVQLEKISCDIATNARILRFLDTHSHHNYIAVPEHDPSILAETRSVLKDLLTLMHDLDPSHYEGMKALFDSPTV